MLLARALLACVASVSARVRRESWEESKKRNPPFFFRFRSNFRAITRLETLATQARALSRVIQNLKNVFVGGFRYIGH